MEQNYPGGSKQYSGNVEKLRSMFNQKNQQQFKSPQQYQPAINYSGNCIV
jgi:hypothetical protein